MKWHFIYFLDLIVTHYNGFYKHIILSYCSIVFLLSRLSIERLKYFLNAFMKPLAITSNASSLLSNKASYFMHAEFTLEIYLQTVIDIFLCRVLLKLVERKNYFILFKLAINITFYLIF